LTFSKGGAPIKKITSIPDLLKDTINFTLSGSKVRCQFFINDDLWSANCDEGQISQVISNLIINAEQAMPEGGVIEVRAVNLLVEEEATQSFMLPGKYIMISIKDHGVGVSEEHLQKIFDPYYTTKQKGRGLGLTTVYSIIKRHDGYIDVESEVGIGTTFHIYLPSTGEKIVKDETGKLNIRKGSGKILVMDDEEMVRDFAKELLSEFGYDVELAEDGEEAIQIFSNAIESGKPFDAVILDLTIPGGMGGADVIQKLREIDPDVKGLVSSGYSNDPIMSNYEDYGFCGVIPKPYKIEEINQILDSILKKSKS
jgi:CheY-like chemotaxis protein